MVTIGQPRASSASLNEFVELGEWFIPAVLKTAEYRKGSVSSNLTLAAKLGEDYVAERTDFRWLQQTADSWAGLT